MKKLSILILAVTLIFAFIGCSTKNNSNNPANITPTIIAKNTPVIVTTAPAITTTTPTIITTAPIITTTITPTNIIKQLIYKNGVYDAIHKSLLTGYEEALVTIKDDIILNIELKRLDQNQVEVNYNDWDGSGERPNLKQYRLDLAKAMVDKQSTAVDSISGATKSSIGWKAAVDEALLKAK